MGGVPLESLSVSDTPLLLHARPGTLTGGSIFNTHATNQGYVVLFDATAAADVTLGTTVPYKTMPVSPGDNEELHLGSGLHFQNGIVAASVTTPTGSTALVSHLFLVLE